ncbi:MAG: hypothetical protein IJB74_04320 [Clostridia bacterium]|nr:hypothetical protein [Clostridia bacterium]
MFGYVRVNKPEMKVKEYEVYRGIYCSLCKSMRKSFGFLSALTLSYDLTFFALARMSFGGKMPSFRGGRCPYNPSKKCNYCQNGEEELRYAAAVSLMMFYFKVKDNIADGSFFKRLAMYLILPYALMKYKKAKKLYNEAALIIEKAMKEQSLTEKSGTDSPDRAAHSSADALGKLMNIGFDNENIYRFGYAMGKFVYLCDAFDDIKKDIKNKSYNVYVNKYSLTGEETEKIKDEIKMSLNMCLAMAGEAYEKAENKSLSPIMENIIYEGTENTMNDILKGKVKK